MNLFHPTSDLRSSRKVASNDEGSGVLFNPTGELRSFRGTDSNNDYIGSSNSNNRNSNNNNNSGNNNVSSSRRLASGNSRSQRNNEVSHSRSRGPASNSVPLTVRNAQVSQGSMKNQGSRKTTSQHLSRPSRVTSDDKKEEFVVALPKRPSPKVTSASRFGDRYNGLQESGKNSLNNDNEMYVNGRNRNGTRSEQTGDELPWVRIERSGTRDSFIPIPFYLISSPSLFCHPLLNGTRSEQTGNKPPSSKRK